MKHLILFSILILQTSFAHLLVGTHKGTLQDGTECSIEVKSVSYLNNVKHPLNERGEVVVNGESFTIQHPPVISVQNISASFDHDFFHGVNATKTGGKAIVIKMEHSQSFEGAREFYIINHEYKSDNRTLTTCSNLNFVK